MGFYQLRAMFSTAASACSQGQSHHQTQHPSPSFVPSRLRSLINMSHQETQQEEKKPESEPPDAKLQQQSQEARKQNAESLPKKPTSSFEAGQPSTISFTRHLPSKCSGQELQTGIHLLPNHRKESSPQASPRHQNLYHICSQTRPGRPKGKQKIKGLSNPSQWCYYRSVLQSLIALPQLFNLLTNLTNPVLKADATCAMRQLLTSYHITPPGGVGPQLSALDGAIRTTGRSSESSAECHQPTPRRQSQISSQYSARYN